MMKRAAFRALLLLSALVLLCAVTAAGAEVFVGQEKPADWEERDLMTVIVLETLSNDAIVIRQGGHSMFIDGGTKKFRPRLAKYLEENGLFNADIYFNTHPHDDHLEAATNMISLGQFHPQKAMSAFPREYRSDRQRRFLLRLKQKDIPYVQVHNEEEFTLGDIRFKVYQWPDGNDPNELSAVLRVTYGDAVILLTGDLTGEGQKWLADTYGGEIRSDILKIPHHGLVTVRPEFIDAVSPALVFFTNSASGSKGSTNQMKTRGQPYLHHSQGSIIMETDGTDWYVTQVSGLM